MAVALSVQYSVVDSVLRINKIIQKFAINLFEWTAMGGCSINKCTHYSCSNESFTIASSSIWRRMSRFRCQHVELQQLELKCHVIRFKSQMLFVNQANFTIVIWCYAQMLGIRRCQCDILNIATAVTTIRRMPWHTIHNRTKKRDRNCVYRFSIYCHLNCEK